MKKQILLFLIVISILSFISVIIFTLPYFGWLGVDKNSNIGSAIGGITAPVIGIMSSILLYMALTKQTESNNDQKLKNESDIIFLLINQLDIEVNMFSYKYNQTKGDITTNYKFTGVEALNEFAHGFRNYDIKSFDFSFKAFYQANLILLIIRSFELIEKRIKMSPLPDELKGLFKIKLDAYYNHVLHDPLNKLSKTFEEYPKMKDEVTEEIRKFLEERSSEIPAQAQR
jgi:hypothetical protein